MRRWVYLALACAGVTVAHADEVGPKRASEIVDLSASPAASCPFLGPNSVVFDTRVLSNGSTLPFAIPPGRVLVVTAVTLTGAGVPAGSSVQSRLYKGSAVGSQAFARRESLANGLGRFEHQYDLSTGSVVANDAIVCADLNLPSAGTFGHLSGYLTKDR